MCGLLGLLAPGASPSLRPQLDWLAHRGPDEAGHYADADLYLGARRLSIIDVAGGRQPLSDEHGAVWGAQNGEIYNFRALRAELERAGHRFRTHSDTEVIVQAYRAWGDAAVKRLRGIFAFALWDKPRRRLLLARDRFGVKPLYYCPLPNGGLGFASEIRPLLALLPSGARPNLAALRALFSVGFVPTPHTAFAGIVKLPAAHILTVENGQVRTARYWDLPAGEAAGPRLAAEAAEGLRAHLERAVAEQRMSEVPLGALISGGLDSAAIAALLQAQASDSVHTFHLGFEAAGYDETQHARAAAAHIGTRHHTGVFGEADFEAYPAVLERLEEPQCSATALPIYRLYEACRGAGLTVILTGEGADELLGGYHWYRGDEQARRLAGLPAAARALAAASPLRMSPAARRVLRSGERNLVRRYVLWQSAGPALGLLGPALRAAADPVANWADRFQTALAGAGSFRRMQYVEAHTRLVDFINFEVDRMSMAHSIEARVPFLDHELWEYAAGLPVRLLLDGQPKDLLRRAVGPLLPASTLARRKQGLAAPYSRWLRRERLPEWAEAALSVPALEGAGYFIPAAVQQLRAEHQAGRGEHARLLMGVLSTQAWHQRFIDGQAAHAPAAPAGRAAQPHSTG